MAPLDAQIYPNGLSADSVDPDADAAVIREMRQRMEVIHRTQKRPTVALVLSGGGAKGAAHVGALKFLEEQKIPVDMVLGTSIGGLVGGLYALGYSPAELQNLFQTQDWSVTLTDRIDSRYLPYSNRIYKDKFCVNIPFRYEDSTFEQRVEEQQRYAANSGHINLGSRATEAEVGANSLANSLPAGYSNGFNVNNLLSSLSVGYQDSLAFKDLPIPFFCVASDIVSCKSKNWSSGSLKTAMRSTMSIPGLFNPVRSHGMVLVDGGTRNNFPTDLAKAMGADYIVGVDLSDANPSYSQINNLGNILSQFITMLGKDSFDRNITSPDVLVKPDLAGYNMLSFNPEAIDVMVSRGYEAAQAQTDAFVSLKTLMNGDHPRTMNHPKAVNLAEREVMLEAILFEGISDDESRILMERIGLDVGKTIGKEELDKAMSQIQATGAFDAVTYSLLNSEEPYRLVFHCSPAPIHQFGFGLRMDTEEWASLILNIGLNAHKLMGTKVDVTAKVGQSQYLNGCFSLDLPGFPTFNFEALAAHYNGRLFYSGASFDENTEYLSHQERLYLSNIKWTTFNVQMGIQDRGYRIPSKTRAASLVREFSDEMLSGTYVGAFARANVYNMDQRYYPTTGLDFQLAYDFDFVKMGASGFVPVHSARMDFRFAIPFGRRVALIPDIHLSSVMNDNSGGNRSISHMNFIGGRMGGRYIEQQIPFVGFGGAYLAADHAAVANADLRVRISDNFYVSALGGWWRSAYTLPDMFSEERSSSCLGAALELGYNTVVGPLRANMNWSSITGGPGFYLSLGFDF